MSEHFVSIILPTFNRAGLLGTAIESVLAQTAGEFELIVVDDASTDETPSLLESFDDARLRVLRLETNGGAARARNRGIAAAKGSLIGFIDSDDVWKPDKLERQTSALERASERVGLCVCSREYGRPEAPFRVQFRDEELDSMRALERIASGTGLSTSCWLVRSEALAPAGGFDESLPRMQDYECSLRVAADWHVLLMSDVLVSGEVQPDSLSASADRYTDAIERIVDRHRSLFERNPKGHSHMIFRAGKYLALEGRYGEARKWFSRSLRIRPLNVRAWVGLLLCATGLFRLFARLKYRRS